MGKAELPLHAPGTKLDRGYIGQSVPRPHAHAKIKKLDFSRAIKQKGVLAVFDGPTVAEYCTPWIAVLGHLKGIKSPPQHAIAVERACSQGEAVAAVVAETRSQAEDAAQLIEVEWEELPVVVD